MNPLEHQAFTAEAEGIANALISPCKILDVWDPDGTEPEPPNVEFMALWDTGATHSAIIQKVVGSLGLVPTGFSDSNHAQGVTRNVPRYLVNLLLPPNVGVQGLDVGLVQLMGNIDVLIGMDIINLGDLTVTNYEAKTVFSFRIPSQGRTDYTQDIAALEARRQTMSNENPPSESTRQRARRRRRGGR